MRNGISIAHVKEMTIKLTLTLINALKFESRVNLNLQNLATLNNHPSINRLYNIVVWLVVEMYFIGYIQKLLLLVYYRLFICLLRSHGKYRKMSHWFWAFSSRSGNTGGGCGCEHRRRARALSSHSLD